MKSALQCHIHLQMSAFMNVSFCKNIDFSGWFIWVTKTWTIKNVGKRKIHRTKMMENFHAKNDSSFLCTKSPKFVTRFKDIETYHIISDC